MRGREEGGRDGGREGIVDSARTFRCPWRARLPRRSPTGDHPQHPAARISVQTKNTTFFGVGAALSAGALWMGRGAAPHLHMLLESADALVQDHLRPTHRPSSTKSQTPSRPPLFSTTLGVWLALSAGARAHSARFSTHLQMPMESAAAAEESHWGPPTAPCSQNISNNIQCS